jgi:chaperone modulatory protein CbpM
MTKKDIVIIADYNLTSPVSLEELCDICGINDEYLKDLIEYDVVTPLGDFEAAWEFDVTHLQRIQQAIRLQRDLEVNLAGVALILDLLDELDDMRARAALLEKHLMR